MVSAYPVTLTRDSNGSVIAEAADVAGAFTAGRTAEQAIARIQDALVVMLTSCMEQRKPIPTPSRPRRAQAVATLPPMVSAKLGLYQAMRRQGVTQSQLAARLGLDPRQVRRLLDLEYRRFQRLPNQP